MCVVCEGGGSLLGVGTWAGSVLPFISPSPDVGSCLPTVAAYFGVLHSGRVRSCLQQLQNLQSPASVPPQAPASLVCHRPHATPKPPPPASAPSASAG